MSNVLKLKETHTGLHLSQACIRGFEPRQLPQFAQYTILVVVLNRQSYSPSLIGPVK